MATENDIEIEFLRKRNVRKEDRVKEILARRGGPSGTGVHLVGNGTLLDIQAVAQQSTGKTYLLPDEGKCLHYYFYFIDEELGLGHVRVPT